MIFNINSTRGQTRFLTCVARVTCLVALTHQTLRKNNSLTGSEAKHFPSTRA